MIVKRFNENSSNILDLRYPESKYPIRCRIPNRKPVAGLCAVRVIDFEDKKVHWSNGLVSSIAELKDVEFIPDIFIFNKYNL